MTSVKDRFVAFIQKKQDDICREIAALDGGNFREDLWQRKGGGGGRTRILQGSNVFDKAGVNTSVVFGDLSEEMATAMSGRRKNSANVIANRFFAAGISIVIHPHNPFAPTSHANYRFLQLLSDQQVTAWWFGGGCDLTPIYLFDEDAQHFHRVLKTCCDKHDKAYYARFKEWCDQYFRITHRDETRGVGGIFFDDLSGDEDALFAFVTECAESFVPAYVPLVKRRASLPFSPENVRWQQLRRGRYAEFNLVYDRGTRFGLQTGGRTESVLMSLPPEARWDYDATPQPGSEEARLIDVLRTPREWV